MVATTIVSSTLLSKIAKAHDVRYGETLTGFKWIIKAGPGLVFGYEEAIGYSVGSNMGLPVRDKDGIGAALMVAGIAARAKREGRTLLDLLDDQARRYGLHATSQLSFRVDDLSVIADAMTRLRATPPTTLGTHQVTGIDDLNRGDGGLPPTDGLRYHLSGNSRVVIRPSGTEPKLKCYLEVVVPMTDNPAEARTRATEDLNTLKQDLTTHLRL
jgi:phosphomannomutase